MSVFADHHISKDGPLGVKKGGLLVRFLSSIWNLLRLKSFDTLTEKGRARERYRRVILTVAASFLARGAGILTTVVTIPLTVKYLGSERYGLWMTLSSVVALLSFADLGMGNGLLNAISAANGRNDSGAARAHISSAFALLGSISLILGTAFWCLYPHVSWHRLFNVESSEAVAETGPTVAILVGRFLLGMPLGIVDRVRRGYQEGAASNLWEGIGNVLGLAGVLLAIYCRAGLPWLVAAMVGGPVVASGINGFLLFAIQRPSLQPRWRAATLEGGAYLLRLGALFLVIQITYAFAFSSDGIIIARTLGPEAVTQFAVPAKLFSIPAVLFSMFLIPLWPAYGEAIARGDVRWVTSVLISSLIGVCVVSLVAAGLLVIFGRPILSLWVGHEISPPSGLLLGLGVWMVLSSVGGALAMFLNGTHIIAFQAVVGVGMAVGSVPLRVIMTHRWGITGTVWGTIIAYSILIILPMCIYVPRLLRTFGSRVVTTTQTVVSPRTIKRDGAVEI